MNRSSCSFVFIAAVLFAKVGAGRAAILAAPPSTQPICIAADVVVDTAGNDANPGTRRSPVKTIGKGISVAGPGGVILVNPGVYSEAIHPINGQIIYGYGGESIDGQHKLPSLASGGADVTLKGFTFKNANSPQQQGAITAGIGWRLEDVEADNNSQAGIDVHGMAAALATDVVLLRCKAIGNGREGIKGGYAANVLVQDCLSDGNNGSNANSPGNEAGGGKWSQCRDVTFLNYTVQNNHGFGLWIDFNNQDITVKGGSFSSQIWPAPAAYCGTGIMIEISQGPVTIDGATFSGNSGGAIEIGESSNIVLSNNFLGDGQYVDLRDMNQRAPYRISNINFSNNTFNHSFLGTDGSAGQFPWDDSQFSKKHITGNGNIFIGSPVAYLGSGSTRQVNTIAELARRSGIGAATTQPAK